MTDATYPARLFLFDRPRIELPLAPAGPGGLPVWLSVGLPGPTAADRTRAKFLADPRLPDSEIRLEWDGDALHLTVGGCHTWVLEPDAARPDRWQVGSEVDACRYWS